ncbi:MAG: XdhC family protein [Candidatus Omnitrophica bacterium]|nr:XdhC family protein [Candidatus Omnitrophota bacterium]
MEILFNKILETVRSNSSCVLATVVSSHGSSPRKIGAKMVVFGDGSIQGTIGGGGLEKLVIKDALEALKRKKSYLKDYPLDKKSGLQVCGGKVSIFIEALEPAKKLVIAGAGHIGLALSFIAKLLGFFVIVVDNRRVFADKNRFPHADRIICAPYKRALAQVEIGKDTFVVIVTHGHVHDTECLEAALETSAAYIGMIGSRAKIKHVFGHLLKKGVKRGELKRVYSPVGLKIGAQTPQEIAVSIAAEMIQVGKQTTEGRGQKKLPKT